MGKARLLTLQQAATPCFSCAQHNTTNASDLQNQTRAAHVRGT